MSAPVRIGGMAPPVFGHGYLYGTDIVAGFGVVMTEFGCLDAPAEDLGSDSLGVIVDMAEFDCLDAPGWMPAGACKISEGVLVVFPVQQIAWREGR